MPGSSTVPANSGLAPVSFYGFLFFLPCPILKLTYLQSLMIDEPRNHGSSFTLYTPSVVRCDVVLAIHLLTALF